VSAFPLVLDGERIRALVVGGGAVAHRKAAALLDSGATLRVVAPTLGPAMSALVAHDRVTLSQREYETTDIGDATLVVAATDRREVNAKVAADAHAQARLVNVADEPAEGDWVSVATHRAGPLVIAVSVGGVPTAATRIRDAIAERFDRRYAGALTALIALRRQVLDAGGTDAWRQVHRELVGPDFCERVETEVVQWR
jgi:precorrin-2 dehydrogenase/sirohydrochlorin ferrochelatase